MTYPADFVRAMADAGLHPPSEILADGRIHRFSPSGTPGDDAGWYVLHAGQILVGCFGNWREGMKQAWSARQKRQPTAAERKALALRLTQVCRQYEKEKQRVHAHAAGVALMRWSAAQTATAAHPYPKAKGVKVYGLRQEGTSLLVPMRDATGALNSLQIIEPNGGKRFLPGGKVKACYHPIGQPKSKLLICEGYATGATLHQETGHAVAVAFNAGNLLPVAMALHIKLPKLTLVLCADDDWKTPGNPGLSAAIEAAKAVNGLLAVPDFTGYARGEKDTDFNDLNRLAGVMEVHP